MLMIIYEFWIINCKLLYLYIERATNPQNVKTDTAAIVAFCVMLDKENDGVQIACKLLATYIQSTIEKQAFQSLVVSYLYMIDILYFWLINIYYFYKAFRYVYEKMW